MTPQSRLVSLVEAVVNITIGFITSLLWWPVAAAIIGIEYTTGQHWFIVASFTVIAIARQYVVRRFFAVWLHRIAVWIAGVVK